TRCRPQGSPRTTRRDTSAQAGRAAPARASRVAPVQERSRLRPLAVTDEVLFGHPPRADSELQLVAQRGLEHLRAISVEREAHTVPLERRDELPELLGPLHHLSVEVRRGTDLEQDLPLRELLTQRHVLRSMDTVADAVRFQELDDFVDGLPAFIFARVD